MSETNTITYFDREFELAEPSTGIVLRILNTIGTIAVRAEGTASRLVKNPSNRAVLFGLLAEVNEADLIRLGSAVLQFEDDREGRKWFKAQAKEQNLRVAPLVDALLINLELSEDLTEAISNFFGGAEKLVGMLDRMLPAALLTTEEAETEEPDESGGEPD